MRNSYALSITLDMAKHIIEYLYCMRRDQNPLPACAVQLQAAVSNLELMRNLIMSSIKSHTELNNAGFANTLATQFTSLKDQFSTEIASQLSGLSSAVSNLNFGAPDTCRTRACTAGTASKCGVFCQVLRLMFLSRRTVRLADPCIDVRRHNTCARFANRGSHMHTGQAFLTSGSSTSTAAALQAQLQASLCVPPVYTPPVAVPAQCAVSDARFTPYVFWARCPLRYRS